MALRPHILLLFAALALAFVALNERAPRSFGEPAAVRMPWSAVR